MGERAYNVKNVNPGWGNLRQGNAGLRVPEEIHLADWIRPFMSEEIEDEVKTEVIAEKAMLSLTYYRLIADVVYLYDRGNYTAPDKIIVDEAYKLLGERKINEARDMIEPVAEKVWGTGSTPTRRHDREPKRVNQYEHGIGIIASACQSAGLIDIPYLPEKEVKRAIRELYAARRHLNELIERVKEVRT